MHCATLAPDTAEFMVDTRSDELASCLVNAKLKAFRRYRDFYAPTFNEFSLQLINDIGTYLLHVAKSCMISDSLADKHITCRNLLDLNIRDSFFIADKSLIERLIERFFLTIG